MEDLNGLDLNCRRRRETYGWQSLWQYHRSRNANLVAAVPGKFFLVPLEDVEVAFSTQYEGTILLLETAGGAGRRSTARTA